MKHTQTVIKHLQSNKKYYYYFAIVFLIMGAIILIRVYATLPAKIKNKTIPITIKDINVNNIHDCPDYWELDYSNNGTLNTGICNNVRKLKKKCKWAKKCNLTWNIVDSICS